MAILAEAEVRGQVYRWVGGTWEGPEGATLSALKAATVAHLSTGLEYDPEPFEVAISEAVLSLDGRFLVFDVQASPGCLDASA